MEINKIPENICIMVFEYFTRSLILITKIFFYLSLLLGMCFTTPRLLWAVLLYVLSPAHCIFSNKEVWRWGKRRFENCLYIISTSMNVCWKGILSTFNAKTNSRDFTVFFGFSKCSLHSKPICLASLTYIKSKTKEILLLKFFIVIVFYWNIPRCHSALVRLSFLSDTTYTVKKYLWPGALCRTPLW